MSRARTNEHVVSLSRAIEDEPHAGPSYHLLRALAHAPTLRNRSSDLLSEALGHIDSLVPLAHRVERMTRIEEHRLSRAASFRPRAERETGVR